MDLHGTWEAVEADDDRRRTWLEPEGSEPGTPALEPVLPADRAATPDRSTASPAEPARTAPASAAGAGLSEMDTGDEPGTDPGEKVPWAPVTVPGHWRNDEGFADSDGPLLYRHTFEHPGPEGDDRWWLRFDGVFYQGDVWLDGGYVGDTEGYFFPHTFEVTEQLAERSDHVLGIEVTCTRPTDRTAKRNITGAFQHSAGIDPHWNPGGIWRPVRLERTGPVRIRHLRVVCQEADETRAQVRFRAVLDAAAPATVTLRSSVGEVEVRDVRQLAAGENQVEWQIRVDEPALWWPHSLGDQPLHDVVVEVAVHPPETDEPETDDPEADHPNAVVSHRLERRIGLRQVDLRGWVLHVNGERLFAKGAALGPSRADLGEATAEDLRRDVALAKEANLDLVRVHSHISRPELYEAADEAGLLIWQDFPLHGLYARSIRKQAQRQAREAVDLLGHHPSIAVWCAHDAPVPVERETKDPDGRTNRRRRRGLRYVAAQELPTWNKSILDRTVKRALDKADGSRPVIAHSGVLPHPPQLDGTDSHLGFGWHGTSTRDLVGFARALPRQVRWVGSFGAASIPEAAEFCEPHRWPDLDWEHLEAHHGFEPEPFDRWVPRDAHPTFGSWRGAGQTHQSEVLRDHIDVLRRLRYRPTGGFVVSQLVDAQPAISTAVADHRRNLKPAYRALAEACRPVIVVADLLADELPAGDTVAVDLHLVSDWREPLTDVDIEAELVWDGGSQHWRFRGDADPDSCVRVATLQIVVPDRPGPIHLRISLDGAVPGGTYRRTRTTRIVAS